MPSAFRNPKNLPEWLQLDFFRFRRPLGRWKSGLGWGMLVVCLAGSAAAYFVPRSPRLLQAGPVSAAHGFINDDCAQCHTQPMQTGKRLLSWDDSVRSVPNSACVQCHDGPPHNGHQLVDLDCATCHREHRGRQMLSRVPDGYCTSCHGDLKANHSLGDLCRFDNVTNFPEGHPEFALWRGQDPRIVDGKDRGQLKFNHAVHLSQQGLLQPDGSRKVLECAACHQPDKAGHLMRPINYDTHCKTCHPLSIRLTGKFGTPELQAMAEAFAREPAPHKEPAVVRATLRERLLDFAHKYKPRAGSGPGLELLFPKSNRMFPVTEQQWTWAKGELEEMEKVLFFSTHLPEHERGLFSHSGGCFYCHIREPGKGNDPREAPSIVKTNLPEQWLPHAHFAHNSHRMVSCNECHDAETSKLTSDILLPRMATCAKCHNDAIGGRTDCAECHRYHQRDSRGGAAKKRTIEAILGSEK